MSCEEWHRLIVADLDGESGRAQRAELDSHLIGCEGCRQFEAAMTEQDAQLRRTFEVPRQSSLKLAERVAARVSGERSRKARRIPWMVMSGSAAAGFLLAAFIFYSTDQITADGNVGIARLALATGPVEVQSPDGGEWSEIEPGAELLVGARIRTGPSQQCELQMADGSEVRLNVDTEVGLEGPNHLKLARGQLFSNTLKGNASLQIDAMEANVIAPQASFDLSTGPDGTVLTVLSGEPKVRCNEASAVIKQGQCVRVADGEIAETCGVPDLVSATQWVHEILVLKGEDDPELVARINDLFARIGETKVSYLSEQQLRALGGSCVKPLNKFMQASGNQDKRQKRERAALIVSQVAQPRHIPALIELIGDASPRVREYAELGLERLTGRSGPPLPRLVTTIPLDPVAAQQQNWQQWWSENKHLYPRS